MKTVVLQLWLLCMLCGMQKCYNIPRAGRQPDRATTEDEFDIGDLNQYTVIEESVENVTDIDGLIFITDLEIVDSRTDSLPLDLAWEKSGKPSDGTSRTKKKPLEGATQQQLKSTTFPGVSFPKGETVSGARASDKLPQEDERTQEISLLRTKMAAIYKDSGTVPREESRTTSGGTEATPSEDITSEGSTPTIERTNPTLSEEITSESTTTTIGRTDSTPSKEISSESSTTTIGRADTTPTEKITSEGSTITIERAVSTPPEEVTSKDSTVTIKRTDTSPSKQFYSEDYQKKTTGKIKDTTIIETFQKPSNLLDDTFSEDHEFDESYA